MSNVYPRNGVEVDFQWQPLENGVRVVFIYDMICTIIYRYVDSEPIIMSHFIPYEKIDSTPFIQFYGPHFTKIDSTPF